MTRVRIIREQIDVTSIFGVDPSPGWSFTDAHGHTHRWEGNQLPTLENVEVESWWCADCHDTHVDTELRCKVCAELVEPGTRRTEGRQFIPGLTRYYVDDAEVSETEALKAIGQQARQEGSR